MRLTNFLYQSIMQLQVALNKNMKIILITLVILLTSCAKPNIQKDSNGPLDSVGKMDAISGIISCMFAPESEFCKEQRAGRKTSPADKEADNKDWDQVE